MTPIDYALTPLKKYATFSGRARRQEYWWFYLLIVVLSVFANLIDAALAGDGPPTPLVSGLVSLATFIPMLAVTVRRFHDRDMSGLFVLVPLIGIAALFLFAIVGGAGGGTGGLFGGLAIGALLVLIVAIWMLVMMLLAGTPGPNRYGEDPKRSEAGRYVAG